MAALVDRGLEHGSLGKRLASCMIMPHLNRQHVYSMHAKGTMNETKIVSSVVCSQTAEILLA